MKSFLKLPPDSLHASDLTMAWILRNLTVTGRQALDTALGTSPAWKKLQYDFSALRQYGYRSWPKPPADDQYAVYELNTPSISLGMFTTDGHVVLCCGSEYLSKPEFECLYATTLLEHLTEHAKERASTIRAFLQCEQACPVAYNISYTSDTGVGSKQFVARSREHIVTWLKKRKLQALDWQETNVR